MPKHEVTPKKEKPENDPVKPVTGTGTGKKKCGFDNPEAKVLIDPDTIIHN